MKKTGAVLVAAGLSSRMEAFKPMLPFGNSTVSIHLVTMLKDMGIDPIVVVVGYRGEELMGHLSFTGVRFEKNERFQETQMFDSVGIGIRAISRDCDRLLILPVDLPAIMPDTIRQETMIDAPIIRTVCHGRPGHPVLIWSQVAESLLSYQGPNGLRGAMENSGIVITSLEVEDEGIYRDMDTRKEYEELLDWNYQRGQGYPIRPQVQVRLTASEPFYGPGTQTLLGWIQKTGSLQEACLHMGMSYSKGRKMVKQLERQLGFAVVQRWAGGSGGGGSLLTEKGAMLVGQYAEMVAEIQDFTDQAYQKYIGNRL
ncbi:MAG: NTP transferase domain-containing protein [Lachnospiraceae bacterium]|nr:NTP transferase domain-containing protein [Lachnospiraceae bacterium]